MSFKTLGEFLGWAEKAFIQNQLFFGHGTNNAWDEAVAIALFVLNLPVDVEKSAMTRALTSQESNQLRHLANRRINEKIPAPYLTHTAWFAGLPFYVNTHVLIPRSPLAEFIAQEFYPWHQTKAERILDLCTGSGCIAVALAKTFPEARIDAIDIDDNALSVARMNIVRHGVEDQVFAIQSDLFSVCKGIHYDIIISNPPYVALKDMQTLPAEYTHEPKLALEAGQDGLSTVRRILQEAPRFLAEDGILIVEVGNAKEAVVTQFPDFPFLWLEFERGGEGVFLLKKSEETLWKPF